VGRFDPCVRVESFECVSVVVTPRDGDGAHVCGAGCFDVHGGVADQHAFGCGTVHVAGRFECSCGVGFMRDPGFLADDRGEGDVREEAGDDCYGEWVRFVR